MSLGAFFGSALGIAGNIFSSERANSTARAESRANREFQEYMTSNRHQIEVDDLRKAGLNPILSAHTGAAVPSGSQANIVQADVGGPASAYMAKRVQSEQVKLLREQRYKTAFESQSAALENQLVANSALRDNISTAYFQKYKDVLGHAKAWHDATGQSPVSSAMQVAGGVGSLLTPFVARRAMRNLARTLASSRKVTNIYNK